MAVLVGGTLFKIIFNGAIRIVHTRNLGNTVIYCIYLRNARDEFRITQRFYP